MSMEKDNDGLVDIVEIQVVFAANSLGNSRWRNTINSSSRL